MARVVGGDMSRWRGADGARTAPHVFTVELRIVLRQLCLLWFLSGVRDV